MNGTLIQRAVALETGARLKHTLEEFANDPKRQIDELYLATVSRFPNAAESQRLIEYSQRDSKQAQRLGDIFWALLNSAEFRWNH